MKRLLFGLLVILLGLMGRTESTLAYQLPEDCNGSPVARSNLVPTFRANWFAGDSPVGDFSEAFRFSTPTQPA